MGCGATKAKEPKSLSSMASDKQVVKPGQNSSENTSNPATPILKSAKPLKSSLVQRKESKRGHSSEGSYDTTGGNSGTSSSNQGNFLIAQKSSVRWKEDRDDRDEPATKGTNASPGSITPTNVTPHTTPLLESNPPGINMRPDSEGGGRASTLGVGGLGVLMEQNSSVSLLHGTSPPSPRRAHSPDARVEDESEKQTGSANAGQSVIPDEAADSDTEAALKIRLALRAQMARRASRGHGMDTPSVAPSTSTQGMVSHSSSGNMVISSSGNCPVSPGSPKNTQSSGSRKGSSSSLKGKDGPNTIVIGNNTAVLIPSSPSFVAMKQLSMNARTTSGTTAAAANTTGDSYGTSEVESHSDDSMR